MSKYNSIEDLDNDVEEVLNKYLKEETVMKMQDRHETFHVLLRQYGKVVEEKAVLEQKLLRIAKQF